MNRRMRAATVAGFVATMIGHRACHGQTPIVLDTWCAAHGHALHRDGATDDSLCVARAAAYASTANVPLYVPAGGPIVMGGGYQAILNNLTLRSDDREDRGRSADGRYGYQGAVFWITDQARPPFLLGAGAVTIDGLNFYWPEQRNSRAAPIAYPALFAPATPAGVTQGIRMRHLHVINAFDFMDYSRGTFGDMDLGDSDIWAIRNTFQVFDVPEVFFVHDTLFSYGVSGLSGGMLPAFYAAHGTWLLVYGTGTAAAPSVRAANVSAKNVFVYGCRYGIRVRGGDGLAGAIYSGSVVGGGFDAVQTILQVDPLGKIGAFSFADQYWNASVRGSPATPIANGAVHADHAAFLGVQFADIYVQANGFIFNLQGYGGQGPQISGMNGHACIGIAGSTCYAVWTSGVIQIVGSQLYGTQPRSGAPNTNIGLRLGGAATVSANQFYNQTASVDVQTATGRMTILGNQSSGTSGPHDVIGIGGANVVAGLNAWGAP